MRVMYDSVNVARIPANAAMVACYRDGRYANEAAARRRFPHALIVTITVRGQSDAHVIDCEQGDATPESAAAWAKKQVARGKTPTIYCNASTWPAVAKAVAQAGVAGKVCYWIAHYDNDPTLPNGAVAKQYRNDVAANLDTSVVASYWPGVDPPRPGKRRATYAAGDTVWTFAKRHGISATQLLTMNDLPQSTRTIVPGTSLRVEP